MERCPTQAVLPPVGLAAEKVIRDRYNAVARAIAPKRENNEGATH
ncbi:MAG: hypothetical protein R6U98_12385 [Pirellulaceae bacterium]